MTRTEARKRIELTTSDELVAAARMAAENAHAPYSDYRVGAALLGCGRVFSGANIENASYGATICAERAALAAAISAGCRELEELVVVTDDERPAVPCGLCLQALAEFAPRLRLVLVGRLETRVTSVGELLPEPFRLAGS